MPPGFNTRRYSENACRRSETCRKAYPMLKKSKQASGNGSRSPMAFTSVWHGPRLAKHSVARIEADNRPGMTYDLTGTLRNQTGPTRDIEHVHAGCESRPQQRFSSIPEAGTKTGCLVDIAILGGGTIEQVVEKTLTGLILVVVATQKRMGRQRHELAGRPRADIMIGFGIHETISRPVPSCSRTLADGQEGGRLHH